MYLYRFLFFTFSLLASQSLWSQSIDVQIVMAEENTQAPIENVHLFIEGTTYGSFTDHQGRASMTVPSDITKELIISHIGYVDIILAPEQYKSLQGDTIYMKSSSIDIEEMVVRGTRSKKWKKNYKKFKEAFLGKNKVAKKCEILNPEVIQIEKKDDVLTAKATDLIKIMNEHLGYEIYYLLEYLKIEADGSSEYVGRAGFVDISNGEKDKVHKHRKEIFESSPKHFYQSLIHNQLSEDKYILESVKYTGQHFVRLQTIPRDSLLQWKDGQWHLTFPHFLQATNKRKKSVSYKNQGLRTTGLENHRFSTSQNSERSTKNYAISHLFKVAPSIIINQYGNVLNSREIKEYGFWAEQRFAHQLPYEYGDMHNQMNQH